LERQGKAVDGGLTTSADIAVAVPRIADPTVMTWPSLSVSHGWRMAGQRWRMAAAARPDSARRSPMAMPKPQASVGSR
jgi:hypothetical protein